jgi:putative addiction module component (TIGR02574 family)
MTQEAADLLKKALALPVSERADLAGSLIESLDDARDESVAVAWDEEVARRMADIDSGAVKPVSLDDARRLLSFALESALPHSLFIPLPSKRPSLPCTGTVTVALWPQRDLSPNSIRRSTKSSKHHNAGHLHHAGPANSSSPAFLSW